MVDYNKLCTMYIIGRERVHNTVRKDEDILH